MKVDMENLDNERQESWRVLDGHYKRQEFEHQLIDRKTTWLLSTQSILFAAYGVTFSRVVSEETVDEFRSVVAWTGVSLSALTMVGVLALVTSKRLYLSKSREYFAGKAVPGPTLGDPIAWGAKTWITVLSLVPDLTFPIVFILAWSALLGASGALMWMLLAIMLALVILFLVWDFVYRPIRSNRPEAGGRR